jgi:hypothetical protein
MARLIGLRCMARCWGVRGICEGKVGLVLDWMGLCMGECGRDGWIQLAERDAEREEEG